MRNIDELVASIELSEGEYETFIEQPLTDQELEEIKESVLKAVKKEQEEADLSANKVVALERVVKRRRKLKRWILPLVATLTIASSLVASGAASRNLGEIFHSVFGDNTSNIGESGLKLGISDTQQGITLSVQGIVGDKQSAIILFDLEKEQGEFQGNNIAFGKLSFYIEEEEKEFKGWNPFKRYSEKTSGYSYGWGLIDDTYQTPSKRIFKLDATLDKDLIGKKGVLELIDITQVETDNWESQLDLVAFLNTHPGYLNQESIPMPEDLLTQITEEELKYEGYSQEEAKEMVEKLPARALPSKKLDLDLFPEAGGSWRVDNIGFIGEQLHIRMSGVGDQHYTPSFKDALGNEIEMTYNITTYESSESDEGRSQGYYVYDIKDLEALSQLRVTAWFAKELQTIEGKWQIPFIIDIKNQEKSITSNKQIPWMNDTYLTIEKMTFSNLSLQISYIGADLSNTPKIIVKFKDGNEQIAHRQAASYGAQKTECIYTFGMPIDVEQVIAIRVGEIEIPVE